MVVGAFRADVGHGAGQDSTAPTSGPEEGGYPRIAFYALNLLDLAENDSCLRYSRRSPGAVAKHSGEVVVLGMPDEEMEKEPEVEPRSAMIPVSWPSRKPAGRSTIAHRRPRNYRTLVILRRPY